MVSKLFLAIFIITIFSSAIVLGNYLTKEEWVKARLARLRISRACYGMKPDNEVGFSFCVRLNDEQDRQARCERIWLTPKRDRTVLVVKCKSWLNFKVEK